MLDGNRFLPETGIPMRKIACMRSPLALADPVPFTFASLNAKSFTLGRVGCTLLVLPVDTSDQISACPRQQLDNAQRRDRSGRKHLRPLPLCAPSAAGTRRHTMHA